MINIKEIKRIAFNEGRRAAKVFFPVNRVMAVASSTAQREVARQMVGSSALEALDTTDATPVVMPIPIPNIGNSIGVIDFWFMCGIEDLSVTAFWKGSAGFIQDGSGWAIVEQVDIIPFSPTGVLTGSTANVYGAVSGLEFIFSGVAATNIASQFSYTYQIREIAG